MSESRYGVPPVISIPFFSSLLRITFFVNISTYQAWLLEAQTAGEPSPWNSSVGGDLPGGMVERDREIISSGNTQIVRSVDLENTSLQRAVTEESQNWRHPHTDASQR